MGVSMKLVFFSFLIAFTSSDPIVTVDANCHENFFTPNYDEENCCGPNKFPCKSGHCISLSSACNAYPDCPDNSDERFCFTADDGSSEFFNEKYFQRTTTEKLKTECNSSEFRCKNEKCVAKYDVCNRKQDCDDGSDEDNCRVFWRNYNGSVPRSAILAWKNEMSEAFIGRTNFNLGVLVNQIYPGEMRINVTGPADPEGHTVHARKDHIDIMCTDNPENLVWLPTNTTYLQNLADKKVFDSFVYGGQEIIDQSHSYDLYICRFRVDGQYLIGKISVNGYVCWFPFNGKEEWTFDYDVLTYKDTIKAEEFGYDTKEIESMNKIESSTARDLENVRPEQVPNIYLRWG